ncbi:N-formylglutamate amidohydrolase [Winogradskyella thalassocola]|uniref:Predicted N-formylglutamate amidohydrolase n=1 Tax=Winogradskyella thalassocola TaxID=262004 RepID=A0A1G8I7M2_9FLAO|nr:N-formylglutamate amidohydrolase [Winogradskyella thalassocola]SDI14827.1 Predicted N-formylglutamate amidohydrolase [Winogradskyella thalassocola]
MKLILTCEHAGNEIPETYAKHFNNKAILESHRGYDLGALDLFQYLKPLSDASYFSTTSRLLVELNRSLFSKQLFSEFSNGLSKSEKSEILETYYFPHRTEIEYKIAEYVKNKQQVLHLSIHSFTPNLNGEERKGDIGLLYDSRQKNEQEFSKQLKAKLLQENPNLNVRFNYPYLGKADGFTTFLRKQFPRNYLGIEIEVNQKLVFKNRLNSELKQTIFKSLNCSI